MMLAIEVAFLTGRYVATAYNTRTEGEWPPHPARLFSALVATHFSACEPPLKAQPLERAALEWLEALGAPAIVASDATPRDVATVFVPVNDTALTHVDADAVRVDECRATLLDAEARGNPKAVKKASADVLKAEAAFAKAVAAATSVPKKLIDPRYGQRVLPEYRGRQPRTFPSMTPSDPRVTYVWSHAEPTAEQRAALDELLRRLIRLGHSSSFVSARMVTAAGEPTWQPMDDGTASLRVVEAGQLMALERAYQRHQEIEPRVMPSVLQPYGQLLPVVPPPGTRSTFSDDWLVLRRVDGPMLPMSAAVGVARTVRRALIAFSRDPIPEVLSGHDSEGRPSLRPHVAIVPLPFVGHHHASGSILAVALVLPLGMSTGDRRAIYRAVAAWEAKYRQEDEETPVVQLNLGRAGELRLERVERSAVQASLRAATWSGPATVWSSVTPVALDRHPGGLRSNNPAKQKAAIDEAVEAICRGCERVDLPRPREVQVLPAAPWAGAAKARDYPPYPDDPSRTQRMLTHARIEFDHEVMGPILLGAGRYVGLGLFRPEVSR